MSGRYRDMANIQQDLSTDDNPAEDFSGILYRDVPCDITAVSGGEKFRGRVIEGGINYVVELHNLPNVVAKMRLTVTGGIHAGKVMNIHAVKYMDAIDGRLPRLELDCVNKE